MRIFILSFLLTMLIVVFKKHKAAILLLPTCVLSWLSAAQIHAGGVHPDGRHIHEPAPGLSGLLHPGAA